MTDLTTALWASLPVPALLLIDADDRIARGQPGGRRVPERLGQVAAGGSRSGTG